MVEVDAGRISIDPDYLTQMTGKVFFKGANICTLNSDLLVETSVVSVTVVVATVFEVTTKGSCVQVRATVYSPAAPVSV
jgi:hypothetical protein